MKSTLHYLFIALALLALSTLNPQLTTVLAQGTAFTYQGRLNNTNGPVTGTYDLTLTLFDASTGGSVIGPSNVVSGLMVANGLFTVTPDFGPQFYGLDHWLEIAVRTNGGSAYAALSPRQKITPTPYSLYAPQAGTATTAMSVSAGAIGAAGLQSSSVTSDKIADSTITAADVDSASFSNTFWKVNGNAGADPANGAFLGTTDNLPLEIRVNGARALRLQPTASATEVNVIGGSVGNLVTNGAIGATVWGGGFDGTNNHGNTVGGNFGTVGGGRQNSANNAETTVAGGRANAANGLNSTVSGGYANTVSGAYASIGGGVFNGLTSADDATIGGGYQNTIQPGSTYATISGGGSNIILSNADRGTIGGGIVNTVGATEGTVAGGAFNSALAFSSTIGGGGGNTVSGQWATIGGGRANLLTNADYATIGGGYLNTIQTNSPYATIGGGVANTIQTNAYNAVIAGGHDNTIQTAAHSAISGGGYNTIQFNAYDSAIGGGGYNTIQTNAHSSFIGGGNQNTVLNGSAYASIGGGNNNIAGNAWATVGGGHQNSSSGDSATVGGGESNTSIAWSAVGGGRNNAGSGYFSVVAGGERNTASGQWTAVGGGFQNSSSDVYATVGGGESNTNSGLAATISGGSQNSSQAGYATVGGGVLNVSAGYAATVPGGFKNTAVGDYSFAAGANAKANHQGSFVWADSSSTTPFASSVVNQFLIRASGGVGINKNNPATALDVAGTVTATSFSGSGAGLTSLNAASLSGSVPGAALTSVPAGSLTGTITDARLSSNVALRSGGNAFTGTQTVSGGSVGIGIAPQSTLDVNGTARVEGANNWGVSGGEGDFRVGNDSYRFKIGVANAGGGAGDVWMRAHGGIERINLKAPGGTRILSNEAESSGVSLAANGTAWAVISDRNVKKDFAAVDSVAILEKLAAMSITQWHYTWEEAGVTPHIGPMAQDFKAAFYPGTDDKSITTQEADGVALAAIQGLNQKLEAKTAEIESLKQSLAELKNIVQCLVEKK